MLLSCFVTPREKKKKERRKERMKKKERKVKRERANSKNRNLQVEIFAFFSSFPPPTPPPPPFLSFLIPPVPSLRFSFSLTRSYITGGCSDRLVVEWLTCLLMLTNCSFFLNSAGDCGPYTCTSGAACHLITAVTCVSAPSVSLVLAVQRVSRKHPL